jgi:fatty-acyl-CoA synthase
MEWNIGDGLVRNARRFPHKPAIVDAARTVTYRELDRRSNALARYFLSRGVACGDRVALACGNSAEHLELLFALAKIGAAAIPFDDRWTVREHGAMLDFFEPKACVLEERTAPAGVRDLAAERFEAGRCLIVGGTAAGGAMSYEEAVTAGGNDAPPNSVRGEEIFIIMLTSGTTGSPKACVVDHQTYALRSLNNAVSKGLDDRTRGLVPLPLHLNAGRQSAMTLLYLGGTVFLPNRFDEDAFIETLERERITYAIVVPAMCGRLLRSPALDRSDRSALSFLGISAGHLAPAVAQEAIERICPNLFEAYASTDCGQMTILTPEDRAAHGDTVGRPIWAVLLATLDDQGRELAAGSPGEICVRSPMAIQGYFRDARATEEFFTGGWCHTGDVGFVDDEGYLHVSGRKKQMIKSGGISLFPEEIEAVLTAHPDVAEAAVVAVRHEQWGEAAKALIVLRPGATFERERLVQFCRQSLASYKTPKVIEVVSTLPRTALGKIDRVRLERGDY